MWLFSSLQTDYAGQLVDPILRIDNGDLGAQDRNTSIVVNITAPLLSYGADHPVTGDATSSAVRAPSTLVWTIYPVVLSPLSPPHTPPPPPPPLPLLPTKSPPPHVPGGTVHGVTALAG